MLAKAFAFAGRLGSQARQASAERAWAAVSRFYDKFPQVSDREVADLLTAAG